MHLRHVPLFPRFPLWKSDHWQHHLLRVHREGTITLFSASLIWWELVRWLYGRRTPESVSEKLGDGCAFG
jgi:cytochrome c oxidase assembly factor CtaG